jgi:transposase-like protein
MNLRTLNQNYSTKEKCRELLRRLRWPNGVDCIRCHHTTVSWLNTQEKFECGKCRYQFSVTANTIFHDTHLSLETWFLAVHLITQSKKGMSSCQAQRTLGIGSYKTAWYLTGRIRKAMEEANPAPLKGTVEFDSTWHGGKRVGSGRGNVTNKTSVMGAIERGGPIRLKVETRSVNRKNIDLFFKKYVDPKTDNIFTDADPVYRAVDFGDAIHSAVDHSRKEWVRGEVSTNSIESVWSLFKRSVIGSYHHLSEKHLQSYLDEMSFRFNKRHDSSDQLFLDTLRALVNTPSLKFKELTKPEEAAQVANG